VFQYFTLSFVPTSLTTGNISGVQGFPLKVDEPPARYPLQVAIVFALVSAIKFGQHPPKCPQRRPILLVNAGMVLAKSKAVLEIQALAPCSIF